MNDQSVASATTRPEKKFSAIWLLPLIAVALSGWLMYKNFIEHGLTVTVAFANGSGITVGKTPVIYQGIDVGEVKSLQLDEDLEGVTATLELSRQIEPLIRENTEFWLVQPQISLSGISGLDTLVEGNYISFKAGDGEPADQFTALYEPPPLAGNVPGLRLRLRANELGSLAVGAPVLYQQIDVGEIEGYQLLDDGVEIIARIEPLHQHLINSSTRFWRQSGVKVSAGLQGVKIDAGSMASILAGGITFETPDKEAGPAERDAEYRLYDSREKAQGSRRVLVQFKNPDGLSEGASVRLRGQEIGRVESWQFTDNDPQQGVDVRLEIKSPYHRFLNTETQFWLVKPEVSASGVAGLDALIGGPYVSVNISGEGGPVPERYTALSKPPQARIQAPGMRIELRSDELGSVSVGSKVYYRKIAVGQVETVELDARGVSLGVFIHERYAHLVHRESLFWNASGIHVSGGLSGINIQAESLATIVAGGIAFHTPDVSKPQAAWEGLRFKLHPTYESTLVDVSREITLQFSTGASINKGTEIKYQGIKVGEVYAVELDDDMDGVKVSARLSPSAKGLAREGSQFWLIKPQLGLAGTRNLETLVTGTYITVRPGPGKVRNHFIALEKPPSLNKPTSGLNLVLSAPQRGSIKEGVKVFYRDIPVGEVFAYELAFDATHTLIHINIEQRYAPLIRPGTKFWNSSGVAVDVGLFRGANIRSKSIESLLEGGIAFATPDGADKLPTVESGSVFELHPSVEPKWLKWQPTIPIHPR
ncbi:paraquat-inducible protein B [Litorivivens lipolytica]|uniref:Paraquat-inducible protein B n=1 Tax=Litorivivens lipolytica TaxID=1524264 RepID=A0A7W4Z577_9GAMM|nr:MlaD family protein [Litorivivens lipolytica]MBB3047209.1 paraquat-inducible protein B [Litorivivens lipolytica]